MQENKETTPSSRGRRNRRNNRRAPQEPSFSNPVEVPPVPGRGRGRGHYPTARQQFEKLGGSSVSAPPSTGIPSLSDISKKLDAAFPVTSLNPDAFTNICIDPYGFSDLCSSVYSNIYANWRHMPEYLAEPEFVALMYWFMIKKVIKVRSAFVHVPSELLDFIQAVPDMDIPAPIVEYINSVGVIELPDHTKAIPDIYVPMGLTDINNNGLEQIYRSLIPVRISDWQILDVAAIAGQMNFTAFMCPFWRCLRTMRMHVVGAPNPGTQLTQFDPANANVGLDGFMARPAVCPRVSYTMVNPIRVAVQALSDPMNLYPPHTFAGAVCFSPLVMSAYLRIASMIGKVMYLSNPSDSISGSLSMVMVTSPIPLNPHQVPSRYEYRSAIDLGPTELQIGRLFKFRRRLNVNYCVLNAAADADVIVLQSPNAIAGAQPLVITDMVNPMVHVHSFVSLYTKAPVTVSV